MNNLKHLRTQSGMKQSELASKLGISQAALSGWETGKFEIDNANLIRISEMFKVSVDYLLGRDEQKEKPATTEDDGLNAKFEKLFLGLSEEQKDLIIATMEAFQPKQ